MLQGWLGGGSGTQPVLQRQQSQQMSHAQPTPTTSATAAASAPAPASVVPGAVVPGAVVTSMTAPAPKETSRSSEVLQTVLVELLSMTLSYGIIFVGMKFLFKELDPNRSAKEEGRRSQRKLYEEMAKNGRKPVKLDEYEMQILSDLVYPAEIDVGFQDVSLEPRLKDEILHVVLLLRRPDLIERNHLLVPPNMLLFGPPGTGKTMMAKAIAREAGAAFINLQLSTTMNKWFGESQKLIRATFSLAWKLAPCVVFIDEIDSLMRSRTSDDHAAFANMKAQLLSLMEEGTSRGVILVGATNRPWDVDEAFLRRMRQLKFSIPTVVQRREIVSRFLEDQGKPELVDAVARRTEGYSGSDLKDLCKAAASYPFREFAHHCATLQHVEDVNAAEMRPLQMDDFVRAMQDVKATGQIASDYEHEQTGRRRGGAPPGLDMARLAEFMEHLARAGQTTPPVGAAEEAGAEVD